MTPAPVSTGGRRALGTAHPLPLVSIVTATYQARDLIPATLASVSAQTLAARELVVVDGGSDDGTVDWLAEHEGRIDLWRSEPDAGIYDALNKGVAAARGEWLYFLGAGDTLAAPDSLDRALAGAPQGSKLVYGDVLVGPERVRYGGRYSRRRLARQNLCHQGVLYRRELFARLGGYDLSYPVWADWAFNLRAFGEPDVRPHYLGQVVACYAGGGFSCGRRDEVFLRDAPDLIRPLGPTSLAAFRVKQAARGALARR